VQSFSIERDSKNNGLSPRTCVAHSMRDFPSSPCVIRRILIIGILMVNISVTNNHLRFWVGKVGK
jgi:hypothetical protein